MMTFIERGGYSLPYHCSLTNDDKLKGNHFLFEINVPDNQQGLDLAVDFCYECYGMPKNTNWFHQGGCLPPGQKSAWHMFEFWTDRQDLILDAAMAVADTLGLEIQFERVTREFFEFVR